jgi:hypothetical protein
LSLEKQDMLLTAYPNGEIRARVPAPVPVPRSDRRRIVSLNLVNRQKLAQNLELPPEVFRYPSCPWPRVGYGGEPRKRTFSLYARQMMARAGGVFSPSREKRNVFLTGTLPGGTMAAFQAMANYSSWAIHRLTTYIPRTLGVLGRDLRWLWCWEFQGRGALHLHAVFELPSVELAQVLVKEFRALWESTLRAIAQKSGVDIFERAAGGTHKDNPEKWRIDAQIAEKSPQRYLAKYLGKPKDKESDKKVPYPVRWYGCSHRLLREFREQTEVVSTHVQREAMPWEVDSDDSEILRLLDLCSSYSVAFCDKVKTGSTFVFYPEEDSLIEVKELFMVVRKRSQKVDGPIDPEAKPQGKEISHRYWKHLEMILVRPWLLERLLNDVGPSYREVYNCWINAKETYVCDLWWLDKYASELLYRQGLVPSVIPPQRSEVGLTERTKKTGKRGKGHEDDDKYPGLPF